MTTSHRIQTWKGKSGAEERQQAVDAYTRLGNVSAVAREVDRNENTVRRWLKGAGVEIDPQPLRKRRKSSTQQRIQDLEAEVHHLRTRLLDILSLSNDALAFMPERYLEEKDDDF